uniref:Putative interferon alpha-inducible protein n=1 Tax=Amblyomma triste TaxID=251400 RepID=A0A023G6J9_AMBTT
MANPVVLYTLGKVAVGAAVLVATAPAVLSTLGFGAAGVTAGSVAAAVQSTMGGFVAKGSLFAICQSWGAAGIPVAAQTAVATAGAFLAALI